MNLPTRIWYSKYNFVRRVSWKAIVLICDYLGLFKVTSVDQEQNMRKFGLDRRRGLERLNSVLSEIYGTEYKERDGMFSEHLVLLSAVSGSDSEVSKLLEIGTHDAKTALILSKLFPSSSITTIDLPDSTEGFEYSYSRSGMVDIFVSERNELLDKAPNVKFRQLNSVGLANTDEKFDLIWIDGAHGYPVVAMDVINSYRLLNDGGIVFIDDIWTSTKVSNKLYKSVGGLESLEALRDAGLIQEFCLFPKRLGSKYNIPGNRKFVGAFRKK